MWDQFEGAFSSPQTSAADWVASPQAGQQAHSAIPGMSPAQQNAQVQRYQELQLGNQGQPEKQVLMAGPFVLDSATSPQTQQQQQQPQMMPQQQMQQQMMLQMQQRQQIQQQQIQQQQLLQQQHDLKMRQQQLFQQQQMQQQHAGEIEQLQQQKQTMDTGQKSYNYDASKRTALQSYYQEQAVKSSPSTANPVDASMLQPQSAYQGNSLPPSQAAAAVANEPLPEPVPLPEGPPPIYAKDLPPDPFLYESDSFAGVDVAPSYRAPLANKENPATQLVDELKQTETQIQAAAVEVAPSPELTPAAVPNVLFDPDVAAKEAEEALKAFEGTASFGAPAAMLQGMPGGNDTWATAPPDLGTLGAAPKPDPTSSAPTPFVLQPDGSILDARDLL